MHIPSLEDELRQILADAGQVDEWTRHVKQQIEKALERIRAADQRVLDERANAVRVCEELSREYLGKGNEIGWKLNASGALEAADRIRAGRYVAPPPEPTPEPAPAGNQ